MEDEQPAAWFSQQQRGGFEVGDRVRVRLQGEYPLVQLSSGGKIAAHQPAEDGRTGTINERIEDETACLYRVWFDEPFPPFGPSWRPPGIDNWPPDTTIDNWLYTAAELEALPPAPPPRHGSEGDE